MPVTLGEDSIQIVWEAAKRLGEFSYAELSAEAHRDHTGVQRLVRRWIKERRVHEIKGTGKTKRFALAETASATLVRPRKQTPEVNMWTAMRSFGAFSPTDLAALATTDTVAVSKEDAATYCRTLLQAGYLRVLAKAVPVRKEARYRLIRNTGPVPPRKARLTVVVDDNDGAVHLPTGGAS